MQYFSVVGNDIAV